MHKQSNALAFAFNCFSQCSMTIFHLPISNDYAWFTGKRWAVWPVPKWVPLHFLLLLVLPVHILSHCCRLKSTNGSSWHVLTRTAVLQTSFFLLIKISMLIGQNQMLTSNPKVNRLLAIVQCTFSALPCFCGYQTSSVGAFEPSVHYNEGPHMRFNWNTAALYFCLTDS